MDKDVRLKIEKIILGSCINNDDICITVMNCDLTEEDFLDRMNKFIFKVIKDYYFVYYKAPNKSIVEIQFSQHLSKFNLTEQKKKEYEKTLNELFSYNESKENIQHYIKEIIRNKAANNIRQILKIGLEKLDKNSIEIEAMEEWLIGEFIKNVKSVNKQYKAYKLKELLEEDIYLLNPANENKIDIGQCIPTGYYELDKKYLNGGFFKKTICLIAGRPGSGKTTILKNFLLECAKRGYKCLFVSLEMSADIVKKSFISQLARVEYGKILRNELSLEEYSRILKTLDEADYLNNIHIIDASSMTISQLVSLLIKYKREHNIDLFALDYIQLLSMSNGKKPKDESDYAEISEAIRIVTRELDIVTLLTAQVNRECEKRADKHPILSDIRNSGQFEQDAFYIFTTYRDEMYYKDTTRPKIMDLSIVKNRFGQYGMVELFFEGEYQNVGNLEK